MIAVSDNALILKLAINQANCVQQCKDQCSRFAHYDFHMQITTANPKETDDVQKYFLNWLKFFQP